MRGRRLVLVIWACISVFVGAAQVDQAKVAEFTKTFSERHPMSSEEVTTILNSAEFQPGIIDKMDRPAEQTMTWTRYRKIFLTEERIEAGVRFWDEYNEELTRVSEKSGVPVEVILGILGVETFFGQRIGSYRVLDALYTLAFGYPKRSSFFTAELEKFFELSIKENLDVYQVKGSYAGAIGYSQFMPSSYLAYAESYSEDDNRDLMSPDDAIASIANYLKVHRWRVGQPITAKVSKLVNPESVSTGIRPDQTLRYYSEKGYIPSGNFSPSLQAALIELENDSGKEYWFGFQNFYVITRYNHSALYAMAVYQLGEAIKDRKAQP